MDSRRDNGEDSLQSVKKYVLAEELESREWKLYPAAIPWILFLQALVKAAVIVPDLKHATGNKVIDVVVITGHSFKKAPCQLYQTIDE